jgi:hypothetical protein
MIPGLVFFVVSAALTRLLALPSLAWADVPPPSPLPGMASTATVLFTGLISGLLAAFGLTGLRRMARGSERIEEEGAPAEPGDESA